MNYKDQILLEEAYELTQIHTAFLQEGFTEQMLNWGIKLFRKKFPTLSQALDQAINNYQKNNNIEEAADIIASALAKQKTPTNEGVIQTALKAAAPYAKSAMGLLTSPQDLAKILNPKTFIQILTKLSKDAVVAANNKLKRAATGEMGVKDYVTAPASLAKGLTLDILIYNLLLHGLNRYEQNWAKPEEKEELKAAKKEFNKEVRGRGDSIINPSPKDILKGASKIAQFGNLGDNTQYYAG